VLVVRRRRQPEPSTSANTPGQSDDVARGGGRLASASRLDPGYDRTEASVAQQAHGAGSTEEAIMDGEDSEEEGKHDVIIDDDVVAWVYDMDSECVPPTPVQEYFERTWPIAFSTGSSSEAGRLPAQFAPFFRVVDVQTFHDWFASDRSHMVADPDDDEPGGSQRKFHVDADGRRWLMPPPLYPPLVGLAACKAGVGNNLMEKFVRMIMPSEAEPASIHDGVVNGAAVPECFGPVLDLQNFKRWCVHHATPLS